MHCHGNALRKARLSEPGRPYLITTVTHHRKPVFSNLYTVRLLVKELYRLHHEQSLDSLAWVVMPDHLHWLFVLRSSSLSETVRLLKGRSAKRINEAAGRSEPLWQKGFHDHALRKEEDIKAVARYVIANPLRAGLAANIGDYPHWDAGWI